MLRVCFDMRIFSFLVPFFLFCSQQKRKNERKKNLSDTIFRFALCMPGSADFNELQRLLQQSAFVQMLKQVSWIFFSLAAAADYAALPSASRSLPGLGSLRSHGARPKIRFRMTHYFMLFL